VLKDLGLTNEQANKVAALVVQVQQRCFSSRPTTSPPEAHPMGQGRAEDKEIGGKNWKETQSLAARALDHFGAPQDSEFRQLLDETGLGQSPGDDRHVPQVGAALSEETPSLKATARSARRIVLEELYPEDVPEAEVK
jgi:hypothetical protein